MKSLRSTLAFLLVTISASLYAQDYAFKVMANKGNNEIKSGDVWMPLKAGSSLKLTDELKLAENSYIGLIHVTGKPLELRKAGNHKVAELASNIVGGSSVVNKYTDFILSSNAENKKNRLSATGAVHRATDNAAIKVVLPETQRASLFNPQMVLTWEDTKAQGPYEVILKDMFEEVFAKFETPETTYKVDLSSYKGKDNFLVEVRSKNNVKVASKTYTVKRLTSADQQKISGMLNELQPIVAEPSAVNYAVLASFYEENQLFIDAIAAWEEAVKLEEAYRETYHDFLVRNGLKK